MIKSVAVSVIILFLSLSSPVLAAESDGGVIEGQIVNGTADGGSVAEQDITLNIYLDGRETGSATTRTDREGYFSFRDLPVEPAYSYQVKLSYQDADYASEWLAFIDTETTLSTEIVVYDSTTSAQAIIVDMAHTIIYIGQDSLQIKENYYFVNQSDLTYIGPLATDGSGNRETLRFSLPDGVAELQLNLGLMECCITSRDDGFSESMPFLPGAKQVSFTYDISYNSSQYTISQKVNYPIINFYLLVEGENIQVDGDRLTLDEPMDIEGVTFTYLWGNEFAAGDTIVARLSGLPQATGQGVVIWILMGIILPAIGFAFVLLRRRGKLEPVSAQESPARRQQQLLIELAGLDDDFEKKAITEDAYRQIRAAKKAELAALIEKSRAENGRR